MTPDLSSDDLARIGYKLRSQRILLCQKIETVAQGIGVSKKVISQVENGRYYGLKVYTLIKLCRYLEISMDAVFIEESPVVH